VLVIVVADWEACLTGSRVGYALHKKGGKPRPGGTTVTNFGKSGGASPAAGRAARSRMLRIIGGSWRGRRLRFPPQAEIRPTPDRVRETLFNWLGAQVHGSRCLDLFAGSGALGLEALSRGAADVTFVEKDAVAVRELRARLAEWRATGAQVEHSDALRFLGTAARAFNIVFLDPPFASPLLAESCRLLEERHWLGASALIYVETDARAGLPPLPQTWTVTKAKRAGAVGYHLITRG
jgi:16S rRNA (guanine966-N2)-methyltransferase